MSPHPEADSDSKPGLALGFGLLGMDAPLERIGPLQRQAPAINGVESRLDAVIQELRGIRTAIDALARLELARAADGQARVATSMAVDDEELAVIREPAPSSAPIPSHNGRRRRRG